MSIASDIFKNISDADVELTDEELKKLMEEESIDATDKYAVLRIINGGAPVGNRNAYKGGPKKTIPVQKEQTWRDMKDAKSNSRTNDKGWFIMPDSKLVDVASDFGGGTNDHVGIFAMTEHPEQFGISKELQGRLSKELEDGSEFDAQQEAWDHVYNSGAIRVRYFNFADHKPIVSIQGNGLQLSKIQRLIESEKIPSFANATYSIEDGKNIYRGNIDTDLKSITSHSNWDEIDHIKSSHKSPYDTLLAIHRRTAMIEASFEAHEGRIGQVGGSLPRAEAGDASSTNPHIKAGRFIHTVVHPDPTDTEQAYKKDGQWTQERVEKVHNPALDKLREGVEKADGPPTVYMTGGGTASGKSTLLQKFPELAGFPDKQHAILSDPDELKKATPEYQRCANPKSEHFFPGAATLVHEESSYLGKKVVLDGVRDGYNVIYDTTGDSGITKLEGKVAAIRAAGAGRVDGIYAFPGSIEEAYKRATARFEGAKDGFKRYVDPDVIKNSHRDVAGTWMNAANKGIYDKLTLWSTDVPIGTQPKLIATAIGGKIKIDDTDLFNKFRLTALL